jgi:hypothetical protein
MEDTDSALGVAVLSVGPMISLGGDKMRWDFKPQYGFNMKGVWRGDDLGDFADLTGIDMEDWELSGTAIVLGNSLVFGGSNKGFTFSIDVDYVMGEFDEISDSTGSADLEMKYKSWRLGAGVRLNF